jgi:hypothetical protein
MLFRVGSSAVGAPLSLPRANFPTERTMIASAQVGSHRPAMRIPLFLYFTQPTANFMPNFTN